jgi:farnesyl-diphosphate farnesyltransferase
MSAVAELDDAFCERLLPEVSRTFALSIALLPEALRPAVRTAYLLCRIVDCIEDEADFADGTREALFDVFDGTMQDDHRPAAAFTQLARACCLGDVRADRELMYDATRVVRAFRALPDAQREAIRPWVLEMSKGMRSYGRRVAEEGALGTHDLADLERYCWYVAGTVGHLLTELFCDWHVREGHGPPPDGARLRELGEAFGLGLQLVNIVKDIGPDAARGVTFLPNDRLAAHGLSRRDLLDPRSAAGVREVMREVCAVARTNLGRASEYVFAWPGSTAAPVRLFCAVPLALAWASLEEVERWDGALRADASVKISRELVRRVVEEAVAGAGDDAALRGLFGSVGG